MVKSASYLMHNTYFSIVRNAVLSKSKAFFQDDSGIAYRYIDKTKWNVQLYGVYNGPIKMFANRFEKDLKVTIQALGWRSEGRYLPLQDDVASVSFWYQTEPHQPFSPLPSKDQLEVN